MSRDKAFSPQELQTEAREPRSPEREPAKVGGAPLPQLAGDGAHPAPARALLRLQRTMGNRAVTRRITSNRIQRWEGFEHIEQGDLTREGPVTYIALRSHETDFPERKKPQSQWPEKWRRLLQSEPDPERRGLKERVLTQGLTYGEILALGGDLYADRDRLDDPTATLETLNKASLEEVVRLVPLLRDPKASTKEFEAASGGRYLTLASSNVVHFSPGGSNNLAVWKRGHRLALQKAIASKSEAGDQEAWALNAVSDHYLSDAFSGGHIVVPRETLLRWFGPTGGGIITKLWHDYGNYVGVPVTNRRGDPEWLAYGDTDFNSAKNAVNRAKTLEAVEASKREIGEAIRLREKYRMPEQFAAESIVPFPVTDLSPRVAYGIRAYFGYYISFGITAKNEVPTLLDVDREKNAREWVEGMELAALYRVQVAEKARIIDLLAGTRITQRDIAAIDKLAQSVTTAEEWTSLQERLRSSPGLPFLRGRFKEERRPDGRTTTTLDIKGLSGEQAIVQWVASRSESELAQLSETDRLRLFSSIPPLSRTRGIYRLAQTIPLQADWNVLLRASDDRARAVLSFWLQEQPPGQLQQLSTEVKTLMLRRLTEGGDPFHVQYENIGRLYSASSPDEQKHFQDAVSPLGNPFSDIARFLRTYLPPERRASFPEENSSEAP